MGVMQETLRLGPNSELFLSPALRESLKLEPGDLVQVDIETSGPPGVTLKLSARHPHAPSNTLVNMAQRMAFEGKCLVQVLNDDGTPIMALDGRDRSTNAAPQTMGDPTGKKASSNANTAGKTGGIDDLIGCVGYHGPSIPVEEMGFAVGQAIAGQWRHG